MEKETISILIAFISALASCFAVWFAARSKKIAFKAYELAYEQDQRGRPSLELYIVDKYVKTFKGIDERLFVFRLRITNKSASRNSIKNIQLLIAHKKGNAPPSKVLIQHNSAPFKEISENENLFKVPFVIDHYSAMGGVAVFKVPNELLRGSVVETYSIKIIDNSDIETEFESIFFVEKDYEEKASQ